MRLLRLSNYRGAQLRIAGRTRPLTAAIAVAAALAACPAGAELRVVEEPIEGGGQRTVFKMTVTPAAEPSPAFKYSLSLGEFERKPGNAAPFYYRAVMAGPEIAKDLRTKYGDDYDKWQSMTDTPLVDLPLDKVRDAAQAFDVRVMEDLREASQRRECDWSWHLENLPGPQSIAFRIPELQEGRELSRMLAMRVRLAVAEGRYADAVDELRINYQLSHDVAAEPILICALVGIAEAGVANSSAIELMAAKDSPNLYWALADMPRPLVDLRRAARAELSWEFNIFPFMRDAETTEHSPQEWARLLANAITQMTQFSDPQQVPTLDKFGGQAAAAGLALATYPAAKQRLLDAGFDAIRVEQMPVGQVVTIDANREFRKLADEMLKRMYIPYSSLVAQPDMKPFKDPLGEQITRGFGYIMGSVLLPGMENVRMAGVRLEWQLNALMAVEAIRMHAAAAGKLPATLQEITEVAVPENPATGKPYDYRLNGDTAVLDMPPSDGLTGFAWRFEIKLAE